jgi:hypothetical protein
MHEGQRSERTGARGACALVAVELVVWTVLTRSLRLGLVGELSDEGLYLVGAQGLRDGLGYCLPSRPGLPAPKYPIDLPAAIAVVQWLTPGPPSLERDLMLARSVVLGSGLVFFIAAFLWPRRVRVGPWEAALMMLAIAFQHPTIVGCATSIMSDLSFSALAYFLLVRWAAPRQEEARVQPDRSYRRGAGWLMACSLA